jgi:myo-inositol 2-dehydrogenase / D-chiro-inositol 1-dehydrogenase
MKKNGRLKVALVGAGGWGLEHARIFAGRQDVDLCAVVGRSLERTRARADEFATNYYLDIQHMLESELPDLVSLCLPNLGHFEPTLQVIEAGYPLLVEKPLVFDLEEANTLLEEAAKRGLFFAINFNHRYARPVQLAQRAIEQGLLGDVVFATWRFGGEASPTPHPHANLIETQCHGFDMLEHLCGPIESIMSQMTDKTGRGYSTLVLALRFADGAVGSLLGSYDSSYAYGGTHALEINGTKGRVLIEDTVRRYTFQTPGDETAQIWQAGYFNDRDREFHRTFDRHVDEVLDAFRRDEEPPIHARAGRRALELAYAAIESFETKGRVAVG